jgi:hypothetical protein
VIDVYFDPIAQVKLYICGYYKKYHDMVGTGQDFQPAQKANLFSVLIITMKTSLTPNLCFVQLILEV